MSNDSGARAPTLEDRDHPRPASELAQFRTVLLVIIAVVVAGWALHATSAVFVPLVASILIALAVMPVRDWVRRRVSPRWGWLGIASAMAVLVIVIALFAGALGLAARQVLAELPVAPDEALQMAQQQLGAGGEGGQQGPGTALPLGIPQGRAEPGAAAISGDEPQGGGDPPEGATGQQEGNSAGQATGGEAGSGQSVSLGETSSGSAQGLASRFGDAIMSLLGSVARIVLNSAVSIVSALVVIFFLTLLILIESEDWRQKIRTITHRRNEWRLTESAEVIAHKVRVYLLVRAVLGLITAALYGLWLWVFGAGLVVVWMILTFLLNFVPTVGSIIAGLLPTIYVFVTQDFGTAVAVGIGLLVIEQIMGNYVDPKVAGNKVAVSPLVVLVALLVWSWVWGVPGALLAVPVTVALVVLGAHVPILRPWALLLSDRTDMEGLHKATRPE